MRVLGQPEHTGLDRLEDIRHLILIRIHHGVTAEPRVAPDIRHADDREVVLIPPLRKDRRTPNLGSHHVQRPPQRVQPMIDFPVVVHGIFVGIEASGITRREPEAREVLSRGDELPFHGVPGRSDDEVRIPFVRGPSAGTDIELSSA